MNISKQHKTYNIFIFILFELIILLLFIVVNNEFIKIASGPRILTCFMFLLVLAFGVLMFIMVEKNHTAKAENSGNIVKLLNIEINDNISDVTNEKETASGEKNIDISVLLPQNIGNIDKYAEKLLLNMADEFRIVQGVFYLRKKGSEIFQCIAMYAYYSEKKPSDFRIGETLPGQAIKNRKTVSLSKIPDNYFTIVSGLGKGTPREIIFLPVIYNDEAIGLIEYATFTRFNSVFEDALNKIAENVAVTIWKLYNK